MNRTEDEEMQQALQELRRATQEVDYYLRRDRNQRSDRAPASSRYGDDASCLRSPARKKVLREVSQGTMRGPPPERAAHWQPTRGSAERPGRDRRPAKERSRGHEWRRARSPQAAFPERE